MEILTAHALLRCLGFEDDNAYSERLHSLFEKSDGSILLELEDCISDSSESYQRLYRYWCNEYTDFDVALFGKELLDGLKSSFGQTKIREFDKGCHRLWELLPENVRFEEPFHSFNYAGDSIGLADEGIYEREYAERMTVKEYEIILAYYD